MPCLLDFAQIVGRNGKCGRTTTVYAVRPTRQQKTIDKAFCLFLIILVWGHFRCQFCKQIWQRLWMLICLEKEGRTSAATTRFGCSCIYSGKSADALLGVADVRHGHRGPSAAAQHTYDPAAASSHCDGSWRFSSYCGGSWRCFILWTALYIIRRF